MTGHRVWHLRGGIHPPENKQRSLQTPIRTASLPAELIVPVQQHLGPALLPCVKVGEHVLKGQRLADSNLPQTAPVHAPSSGRITRIAAHAVLPPASTEQLCVFIETDGEDRWIRHEGVANYRQCSQSELLARIRAAGIVGLGGAGFPTEAKLLSGASGIQTLIINGAECEPYITADDALMRERAADIITGIEILAFILQAQEVLIGIEDNKSLAIGQMKQACAESNIEVVVIPSQYPSGGEKQLIKILTGKEVPSAGLSAQIGVIVQNIGTVYSIFKAIIEGQPLISRITTLTGQALGEPGNVQALIGTPIQHLLHEAKLNDTALFRLITGGPLMGYTLDATTLPLSKTTNCLIAATREEMPPPPPEQACIRCGHCADVCPVTLLPQQLYFFSQSHELDKAEQHNIFDCIECGACAYVCPSHIPLVQYYRQTKDALRLERHKERKSEHARQRFENRNARLLQEAADKSSKRRQRIQSTSATAPQVLPLAVQDASIDLRQLKTAATTAAKLAQDAKKALIQAERKQASNLEELRAQVENLQKIALDAKQKLLDAEATPMPADEKAVITPSEVSLSKADKIAAALARNEQRKQQQALLNTVATDEKQPTREKPLADTSQAAKPPQQDR